MEKRGIFESGTPEDLRSLFTDQLALILDEIHCPDKVDEVEPEIESHEAYRYLMQNWEMLDYRSRKRGFRRLLKIAREIGYSRRPFCVRCGECCEKGGPSLHEEDLHLIQYGVIKIEDLYTLRKGEIGYSSMEDELVILPEERIKIKEKEGKRECIFYDKMERACTIYEDRPLQCRVLECWNPEAYERALRGRMLTRKDIVHEEEGISKIIEEHEKRCHYPTFHSILKNKRGFTERDMDKILDMLRYDYYLRALMVERLDLAPERLGFILGRPLKDLIAIYGLRLEREGDESFKLMPNNKNTP